jgi:hypothetical protein
MTSGPGKWLRALLSIGVLVVIAGLLPMLILPLAGPARAARIVFVSEIDPARLPAGVTVEDWSGRMMVLNGVDAAVARKLYAMGAAIVYPVRPSGCVPAGKA